MKGLILQSNIHFSSTLVLSSLPFGCAIHGRSAAALAWPKFYLDLLGGVKPSSTSTCAHGYLASATKQSTEGLPSSLRRRCLQEAKLKTKVVTTMLSLKFLSKRYGVCQSQMLLLWVYEPLREFQKVHRISQDKPLFLCKSH